MRCVVGYLRLSNSEAEADPRMAETLAGRVHEYARTRGLPVEAVFVDRYGTKRAPLTQFGPALDVVRRHDGLLVIPTLGRTRRDPEFLEALYNAAVPFEVLDQPQVTRDTILAWGMSSLRADLRRS